jgi:hypothetical protein
MHSSVHASQPVLLGADLEVLGVMMVDDFAEVVDARPLVASRPATWSTG